MFWGYVYKAEWGDHGSRIIYIWLSFNLISTVITCSENVKFFILPVNPSRKAELLLSSLACIDIAAYSALENYLSCVFSTA